MQKKLNNINSLQNLSLDELKNTIGGTPLGAFLAGLFIGAIASIVNDDD